MTLGRNVKKTALTAALATAMILGMTAVSLAVSAVATGDVNVRRGPGTGYAIVDQLYDGEDVDVDRCTGGWCWVEHPGRDGWVSARYLSRDGGYDRRYDHGYYDDDADFFIGRPHPRRFYRPYPDNYVCLGGPNARFCFSD